MTFLFFILSLFIPWFLVLSSHPLIAVLLLLVCAVVCFKPNVTITSTLITLLLIVQIIQIDRQPLIVSSPTRDIEVKNNLAAYPPLPLPVAYWFEMKPITQKVFAHTNRAGEVLNPSLYFFANHPRERAGYREYEKYQFILLPFFIYGLYLLIRRKKYYLLCTLFLPFFVIFTLFGNRGELGPFGLIPFITLSIFTGLEKVFSTRRRLFIAFIFLFVLATIQTYVYSIS